MFKELKDIAFVISVFDKFERIGLITWRQKDKILIIEESLTVMKLAEGKKGFQNFLNQAATLAETKLLAQQNTQLITSLAKLALISSTQLSLQKTSSLVTKS